MTGEVTLTGDILAIGGLNEKLLAAKRTGITNVAIPARNKKDLPDLPKELLKGMNLIPMNKVGDAIKIAFDDLMGKKAGNKKTLKRKKPGRK